MLSAVRSESAAIVSAGLTAAEDTNTPPSTTPFLLDLLDQGLAVRTTRRHRDNLWLLGGELIRRRYEDDDLAKMDALSTLRELVEEDGGPLMWPRITEADQDSVDATCRKLHRFLQGAHK